MQVEAPIEDIERRDNVLAASDEVRRSLRKRGARSGHGVKYHRRRIAVRMLVLFQRYNREGLRSRNVAWAAVEFRVGEGSGSLMGERGLGSGIRARRDELPSSERRVRLAIASMTSDLDSMTSILYSAHVSRRMDRRKSGGHRS